MLKENNVIWTVKEMYLLFNVKDRESLSILCPWNQNILFERFTELDFAVLVSYKSPVTS